MSIIVGGGERTKMEKVGFHFLTWHFQWFIENVLQQIQE